MAWKYGLRFWIVSVMFNCNVNNWNCFFVDESAGNCTRGVNASCCKLPDIQSSYIKKSIVLVNCKYSGVIRYFNYSSSQNITDMVETYIIGISDLCMVTNETCNVKGIYLNTSSDYCNTHPVCIKEEFVKCIFCVSNITWNFFPSNALQINVTTCNIAAMNPDKGCHNKTNDTKTTKGPSIRPTTSNPSVGGQPSLKFPSKKITILPVKTNHGLINSSTAVKIMNNLHSLINEMGNETLAAIYMGEVKGIIEVIPKTNKSEDFHYVFTSNNEFAKISNLDTEDVFKSFMIPNEAIDIAQKRENNSFIGIFRFPLMIEDENNNRIFNSEVFAIEMGTPISNLSNTINITFKNASKGLVCSSWGGEGENPSWEMHGCYSEEVNNTLTCRWTHLTFFAVLMSSPANISSSDVDALTYITYIGCGTSAFFLGVALFMHFLFRRLKASKATKILLNLFTALFMLNLTFLLNEWLSNIGNIYICKFIAGTMHYFMLSTFTWFAIEAFHLYLQLIKVFNINVRHYMLKILVVGWVLPLLVTFVIFIVGKYGLLIINATDQQPVYMCWIIDDSVNYIVNIGYYAAVSLFTTAVFIVVVKKILYLKRSKAGLPMQRSVAKDMFTMAGLCCLLGITWGFAFFSYGPMLIPSYYIFTILNSFQGFFLFLYYYNTSNVPGEKSLSTLRNTISNFMSPSNVYKFSSE